MQMIIAGILCLSVLLATGCNPKVTQGQTAQQEKHSSAQNGQKSSHTASHEIPEDVPPEVKALLSNPNVTVKKIEEKTTDSKTTRLNLFGPDDTTEEHGWNKEAIQYMEEFKAVLKANPIAARPLLSKVANARFGTHPFTDEWKEILFQMARDGRISVRDVKRFFELELEMLIATDPKAYAKGIQALQVALTQFNTIIFMMEKNGTNPNQVYANIKLSGLQ